MTTLRPALASPRCLALLACLPAAAGASAGTVTLLSQERSVSATVTGFSLYVPPNDEFIFGRSFPEFEQTEVLAADDFEPFEASDSVFVDAGDVAEGAFFQARQTSSTTSNPRASQVSSFEQRGSSVAFSVSGSASPGAAASSAGLVFDVTFSVDEPTPFTLTGTGRTFGNVGDLFFKDAEGGEALWLYGFSEISDNGFFADYDLTVPGSDSEGDIILNTGIIETGTYRFGLRLDVDVFIDEATYGNFDDFGIVFADSTLAIGNATDPLVAIPSPAALPAGLALLGAGLTRRRRHAAG